MLREDWTTPNIPNELLQKYGNNPFIAAMFTDKLTTSSLSSVTSPSDSYLSVTTAEPTQFPKLQPLTIHSSFPVTSDVMTRHWNTLKTTFASNLLTTSMAWRYRTEPSVFTSSRLALLNKVEKGQSVYGIFCTSGVIAPGQTFGPVPKQHQFLHCIDVNITNNWMLHISKSTNSALSNLIPMKYNAEPFFCVTKPIFRNSELIVFVGGTVDSATGDSIENSEAGFKCEQCGKIFAYRYYRDKHLKYTKCVDNGNRKYPCKSCNRSFEKRDRLRIHVLHVHEKHKPHKCTVCNKRFSQSSSLNKHLRVHSGERPYKCPYCHKAFTASSILRTHIRQHSGEKPFKCKYCGKAFASHAAHDSHVRRTHKMNNLERNHSLPGSASDTLSKAEDPIDVVT